MGHESFVLGLIAGPYRDIAWNDHNRAVIAALPESGDWPFLTRSMFGIAGPTPAGGTYRTQVIHFGASFKALEWEWHEWLERFERLLEQLAWRWVDIKFYGGVVGDYNYRYEALTATGAPTDNQPGTPAALWTFGGGPRSFPFSGPDVTDPEAWERRNGVWVPNARA